MINHSDNDDRNDSDQGERPGPEKKERVLHTRVSADLEEGLKRRATELGTSVSGLVRHTLVHTLGALEQTIAEESHAGQRLRVGWVTPLQGPSTDEAPILLGWQELVINLNAVCVQCNILLKKGTRAALAVYERSGPRQFLCCECLGKLGEK